jgi:hypothetical protein
MGKSPKVDPLTLAVRFQREFDRLAAVLMRNHGVLPSQVGEQTPHQLFDAVFGESAKRTQPPSQLSPLEVLRNFNLKRAAKGLDPVAAMFGKTLTHIPDI